MPPIFTTSLWKRCLFQSQRQPHDGLFVKSTLFTVSKTVCSHQAHRHATHLGRGFLAGGAVGEAEGGAAKTCGKHMGKDQEEV